MPLDYLNFFFKHIYLLMLVIVGGIGNGFVIIIFGRRALRTTSGSLRSHTSVYPFLFYMAISDTFYLSILFCLWLTNYINILHRPVICEATLYLTYVCNFINAYYTVAFTGQRLFAVVQPFRVSHLLSWHRSRSLALVIVLLACSIYSYLPFLTGVVNGQCYSLEHYRKVNEFMDIVDCILVFLLPYLLIISMNTLIVFALRQHRHSREELLFQNTHQVNRIREITRRNASRKMTHLLLTVSTLYLIVCAPYACIHTWRLLNPRASQEKALLRQLEYYFHLIYHMSFAMNFYIYILFGSKFRREFKRFVWKCKINFYQCFRHEQLYDNDDCQAGQLSSHWQPMLFKEQNITAPTSTSSGLISPPYRWKQPKALYM